jgi:hypothetical protein
MYVVALVLKYLDRQRALEFFGALRSEIQTFIENSDNGKQLMPSTGDAALTWEEIRRLATD